MFEKGARMLKLSHLRVAFHVGTSLEKEVIHDLSLYVPVGEFVTIIGGNGAGKSTLMRAIAGDIIPTKGSIALNGQTITHQPPHRRAAAIARVAQDPLQGSWANLTLEENFALASLRGHARKGSLALTQQQRDRFQTVLSALKLGLENRMQAPMHLLSGGERQVVNLMMATLQPASILLLDEHTAALDPKMVKRVMALTDQIIAQNQLTALMVTHSMTHALSHGSRTLVMQNGKIARDLSGEERSQLSPLDLVQYFE
jgi:putative ABC transport system ATP-binding protein